MPYFALIIDFYHVKIACYQYKGLKEKLNEYFALVAFFSSFVEFCMDEVPLFVVLSSSA